MLALSAFHDMHLPLRLLGSNQIVVRAVPLAMSPIVTALAPATTVVAVRAARTVNHRFARPCLPVLVYVAAHLRRHCSRYLGQYAASIGAGLALRYSVAYRRGGGVFNLTASALSP